MKHLPLIHLINLDRSVDRLQRFKQRNPHITDFVRVSAVDGAKVDREALVRAGVINSDLQYGPGALGCALSHMQLWDLAAAQDSAVTIFEDDTIISKSFEKHSQNISANIPSDWDFVQWGYTINPLFAWVDLFASRVRLEGYGNTRYNILEDALLFQEEKYCPGVVKLCHSFGCFGYSISAKGARAALKYCRPLRDRSVLISRCRSEDPSPRNRCCAMWAILQYKILHVHSTISNTLR